MNNCNIKLNNPINMNLNNNNLNDNKDNNIKTNKINNNISGNYYIIDFNAHNIVLNKRCIRTQPF